MKAKRMPVKKVKLNGEDLWLAGRTNKLQLALDLYNKPRTNVIVHGSALEEVPLDTRCGVKTARMVENPFIAAIRKKYEERENGMKLCACGCGELIKSFDKQNRPMTYKFGHYMRGKKNPHLGTASSYRLEREET